VIAAFRAEVVIGGQRLAAWLAAAVIVFMMRADNLSVIRYSRVVVRISALFDG